MNDEDELREIWQSQSQCEILKGEDMLAIVHNKLQRFDRMIAARNWLECIAGVAVAIFFVWTAAYAPTALMKIGFFVTAAGAAWIVFYIIRYGNSQVTVDPSQNLADYTLALVRRYDHQISLLRSVKYWYLLPIYAGLLITSAGLLIHRSKTGSLGWQDLLGPAIYTAVFVGIWWLNEVAAVGHLRKERTQLLAITGQDQAYAREKWSGRP